ncbi:MAG TPA: DUF4340 domain-containing protein [Anaerolineae bacterium]|nr:DUF4340 domain-containing protein [Anaerolineae bacterium]
MRFRNTLIMLAVLAALVSYVLLVESKRELPPEDDASSGVPTPLPQILAHEPADVKALRLTRASTEQRTELSYEDDGLWYVTVPTEEEADQSKSVSLAASLVNLRPQRVLTATVAQLADYELDPPAMQVEIEMKDDVVYRLNLGAANAARSGYYGQLVGDGRVYLLPFHVGVDVERYLNDPPVKPTPVPAREETLPPRIPPPPTATRASSRLDKTQRRIAVRPFRSYGSTSCVIACFGCQLANCRL